jgi:hypothetical protein
VSARLASLAALAVVAVLLAGCGGSAHHASCAAQYRSWQHGPARPFARAMASQLSNLDFAAAGRSAASLESWPMPACADPAGYWPQLLRMIEVAGRNESAGLVYILGQYQQVKSLEGELEAELKKTVPGVVTG